MVADVKRPDTMALDEVKTVIGGGSEVVVLGVHEFDGVRASGPVLVWLMVIVMGCESSSAIGSFKQLRKAIHFAKQVEDCLERVQ